MLSSQRHVGVDSHRALGDMLTLFIRKQLCEVLRRRERPPRFASGIWPKEDILGSVPSQFLWDKVRRLIVFRFHVADEWIHSSQAATLQPESPPPAPSPSPRRTLSSLCPATLPPGPKSNGTGRKPGRAPSSATSSRLRSGGRGSVCLCGRRMGWGVRWGRGERRAGLGTSWKS